jgi:hypothetical protein
MSIGLTIFVLAMIVSAGGFITGYASVQLFRSKEKPLPCKYHNKVSEK